MTANIEDSSRVLDRRDFLVGTAAVGGAMVLGFHLPTERAGIPDPGPALVSGRHGPRDQCVADDRA